MRQEEKLVAMERKWRAMLADFEAAYATAREVGDEAAMDRSAARVGVITTVLTDVRTML